MNTFTSWHVGVSAETYAAALFARYGYDVSVQYGADQPEYDLIVSSRGNRELMLKISVKGSKDGGWGLTQKYKKGCTYHEATQKWLDNHSAKTIFCLVQFQNVELNEMPRMYLATPKEIADRLDPSSGGYGETILYENHTWGIRARGYGTTDRIPYEWKFTPERARELFETYGK